MSRARTPPAVRHDVTRTRGTQQWRRWGRLEGGRESRRRQTQKTGRQPCNGALQSGYATQRHFRRRQETWRGCLGGLFQASSTAEVRGESWKLACVPRCVRERSHVESHGFARFPHARHFGSPLARLCFVWQRTRRAPGIDIWRVLVQLRWKDAILQVAAPGLPPRSRRPDASLLRLEMRLSDCPRQKWWWRNSPKSIPQCSFVPCRGAGIFRTYVVDLSLCCQSAQILSCVFWYLAARAGLLTAFSFHLTDCMLLTTFSRPSACQQNKNLTLFR